MKVQRSDNTSNPNSAVGTATSGTYRAQQNTLLDEELRPSLDSIPSIEKNRFLLTLLTGTGKGGVYKLEKEELTLGRSDTADITIPDPSLSRIHARFRINPRGAATSVTVEDCNSTNGTYVAGERVSKATFLTDGVRLGFGKRSIARFGVQDALEEHATFSVHDHALRDGLTRVYNRRVFDDRLLSEFAFAERHGRPLSVALLDIDHFKKFNDVYGHQAGDHVLQAVAEQLGSTLRVEDLLARYGGEEFVILARDTTPADTAVVAERVRSLVQYSPIQWRGESLSVTVSVGIASNFPTAPTAEQMLQRADAALYQAKDAGRNCVRVHGAGTLVV